MIPSDVIYQDFVEHTQEYTEWIEGLVKEVVMTAVITYIHLGVFIGILKYFF